MNGAGAIVNHVALEECLQTCNKGAYYACEKDEITMKLSTRDSHPPILRRY